MWTLMDWRWTTITFVTTYVMGILGGVAVCKWLDMYQEARDAGVIA